MNNYFHLEKSPLVIVGTGMSGYMLAKEFRKYNKDSQLILITSDAGEFYSKPLLSTALTHQRTLEELIIASSSQMVEQLNATILTNSIVDKIDHSQREIHIGENIIPFDRLILACGSIKNKINFPGIEQEEIASVNNIQDYRNFRHWLNGKKHIIIIGAGLVGCEIANDCVNAGYQVSLIAPESYPCAKFVPQPVGECLMISLFEKGMRWYLNHTIIQVERNKLGYTVFLEDGTTIHGDGLFSAVGIRPNIELAKKSGIQLANGIKVDRWLQTNLSDIYALGDCAEVAGELRLYIAPLLQCAKALAKILCGGKEPVDYPTMPIVIKTPACPIVTMPPPNNIKGEWEFVGEGKNLSALFHDNHGQLRGFSLVGTCVRDKMQLAKSLPPIFNEENK